MKQSISLVLLITVSLLFFQYCSDNVETVTSVQTTEQELEDENGVGNTDESGIFITDRTGKKWDVTHAKEKYGFEPENFQFGLGPNAIKPIILPKMLSPGDEGYPNENSTMLVMGVNLNNNIRAYPISTMSQYEVADEVFGNAYVAVAY